MDNVNSKAAPLTAAAQARAYILAGAARVTFVSKKTGVRFTYRVAVKDETVAFVGLLSGPDNNQDFAYLGTVFQGSVFKHGKKSRISADAPSSKAFGWAFDKLSKGELPESLEIGTRGAAAGAVAP